jgi:hypothetical protein
MTTGMVPSNDVIARALGALAAVLTVPNRMYAPALHIGLHGRPDGVTRHDELGIAREEFGCLTLRARGGTVRASGRLGLGEKQFRAQDSRRQRRVGRDGAL